MASVDFDPFSDRFRQDPYPAYQMLRDEAPVHFAAASDHFVISRFADVEHVLREPARFSSKLDRRRQMPTLRLGPIEGLKLGVRMMRRLKAPPWALARARFLSAEDGAVHAAMRAIVNRGFTPRRIAEWEGRARALAGEGITRLRSGEPFDLVRDLATPLPVTIIAEMLGVETSRMHDFKRWSDAFIAGGTGSGGAPAIAGMFDALGELREYLGEVLRMRRAEPKQDLVSALVASDGLDDLEILLFVFLLLMAGNETTTNLLGNAVDALLTHPEQLARVQADPATIPDLVEEVLRWDSPVQMLQRRAVADEALHGVRIPKDSQIAVLLGAANRDERRFPNPDRFEPTRRGPSHLAFGLGPHFCLGASLARLEARVALEALVPELGRLARVHPERELVDSFIVRGVKRLELRAA